MKNIQDLLKKKKISGAAGAVKGLDEKTLARIFLEAAKKEIRNFEEADARAEKLKNKTLYIKTAHPVIASELFLRKEDILRSMEDLAGGRKVERLII
ncbi:MAG: DciA family protein [Candidatus Moranbacteria bacterium]|nr:DciA family protein [Candidatus Moranbacteria bacterium]